MSPIEEAILRKIDIPTYYSMYIDRSIDLNKTNKVCCPFHKEDTPSFSYNPDKKVWRCFGACHFGGDVIAMHQKNLRLENRIEAISSLAAKLGIKEDAFELVDPDMHVDENVVKYNSLVGIACSRAKTVQDYTDLDYIMSQHLSLSEMSVLLEMYCNRFR